MANENSGSNNEKTTSFEADLKKAAISLAHARDAIEQLQYKVDVLDRKVDGLGERMRVAEEAGRMIINHDHQIEAISHKVGRLDDHITRLDERLRAVEDGVHPSLDAKSLATYAGALAGGATLLVIALATAGAVGSRVREALVSKDQLAHERELEKLALSPSPLIVSGGTTVPTASPSAEFVRGSFVA